MKELVILVYADRAYEDFVAPYIFYALKSNPNAFVEVVLDESDDFLARNEKLIFELRKVIGENFLIRQATISPSKCIKNTIRFLESTSISSEYIYIGDIDILVFENIVDTHTSLMVKYSLPFSNIIRKHKREDEVKRLTGLHFCKRDDYYPLPDLSDLDLLHRNDENVLYEIMKRKGLMVPDSFDIRPECGIHMSLSRDPIGRYFSKSKSIDLNKRSIGWGGTVYYEKFKKSLLDPDYQKLAPYFTTKFKFLSLTVESLADETFVQLQQVALTFGLDKRLYSTISKCDFGKLKGERKEAILQKDYNLALIITQKMLFIWNNDISLYLDLAWCYLALKDYDMASVAFKSVEGMPGGAIALENCNFYPPVIN